MDDEQHGDDDHGGRMYEHGEAMGKILAAIVHHASYPQDNPIPVKVELSDEQWNAVACALQMILIAQFTEGSRMLAEFMVDQIHRAYHAINSAMSAAVAEQAVDELIKDALDEQ